VQDIQFRLASYESKVHAPAFSGCGISAEGKMLRYLKDHPAVFDPDTVDLLCGALDDAWQIVEANKATFKLDGQAEGARTALAKHIVEMAKNGERNRLRLIEGALTQLLL
jgi:hypothetical protein